MLFSLYNLEYFEPNVNFKTSHLIQAIFFVEKLPIKTNPMQI